MLYSLSIFTSIVVGTCVNNFLENQGDFCVINSPNLNVVKYYETGKSCYVNGIFYSKCEESNVTKSIGK